MTVKQCISWVAVSSRPQLERESPQEQKENNEETIRDLGGVVHSTLEVPGHSREYISFEDAVRELNAYRSLNNLIVQRLENPSLASQTEMILVCRDLDRLGRTAALISQVVGWCHKAGIAIYSRNAPPSSLDPAAQAKDHSGVILTGVQGAFSQIEMLKLRERRDSGMKGKVKRGEFPSGTPWGWVERYSASGDMHYEIDPQAALIIRALIIELFTKDGLSTYACANELNKRGMRTATGRKWSGAIINKMLAQMLARYAGYTEFNRRPDSGGEYIIAEGNFPAIITEAEYQAAQEELERREELRPRQNKHQHKFRGAIFCESCEKAMWTSYTVGNSGRGNIYYYYKCHNEECTEFYGRMNRITELQIEAALIEFLDWAASEEGTAYLALHDDGRIEETQSTINSLQDALNGIAERRSRLLRAYVDLQTLDEAEYQTAMQSLTNEKNGIEGHLRRLQNELRTMEQSVRSEESVELTATETKRILDEGDPNSIRRWAIEKFRIYIDDRKIHRIEVQ